MYIGVHIHWVAPRRLVLLVARAGSSARSTVQRPRVFLVHQREPCERGESLHASKDPERGWQSASDPSQFDSPRVLCFDVSIHVYVHTHKVPFLKLTWLTS